MANHKEESNGYVFGNFTLLSHFINSQSTKGNRSYDDDLDQFNTGVMLFVNRTLFKQIFSIYSQYNKENNVFHKQPLSTNKSKSSFCEQIYNLILGKFYDRKCATNNSSNKIDFVRYVPCFKERSCNDFSEMKPLPYYQFTYSIDNQQEPT